MHIVKVLRYYLGYTQMELAEKSGVSYADVNEIENKPEYGQIGKYCRIAKALHVPVHTIVMNDILSVPEAFFAEMQPAKYTPATKSKSAFLGRAGEDAAFHLEQERLASVHPVLSKLVLPCYKLKAEKGYDILSFKNNGTPMYIEVKTSEQVDSEAFQLTRFEHETAKKLTEKGYEYWIYLYSGWGTEHQRMKKISFRELLNQERISCVRFLCDIRPRKETENGIVHFRKQKAISQMEAACMLEIPTSCLCKYEAGENQCPVTVYQKLAKFYGVTIDELLLEYPVKNCS